MSARRASDEVDGGASAGRARRTQPERRREAEQRLLDAAARLIARQGARGTSLAQVGEAAGYSRGLASHYFGSKSELVNHLVKTIQQRFVQALPKADELSNGLDGLLAVADSYLALRMDDRERAFMVMWAEAVGTSAELRPAYVAVDRMFRKFLQEAIEIGVADGSIRSDVDVRAAAASLVGQFRGVLLQLLLDPKAFDAAGVRKHVLDSIRRSLTA